MEDRDDDGAVKAALIVRGRAGAGAAAYAVAGVGRGGGASARAIELLREEGAVRNDKAVEAVSMR